MVQTVSFYTTGEAFTNLMNDMFEEGRFKIVFDALKDGGLPLDGIKQFFLGEAYFEGDTRVGDHSLKYIVGNKLEQALLEKRFYSALNNLALETDTRIHRLFRPSVSDNDKNLIALFQVFSKEELINIVKYKILESEFNSVNPPPQTFRKDGCFTISAALLKDGTLVTCDYADHSSLYPVLYSMGLSTAPDWVDDLNTIHISGGSISGRVTDFHVNDENHNLITEAQIDTLIKYKNNLTDIYGENVTVIEAIHKKICHETNHGGKFNNLTLLKKVYPHMKFPKISKEFIPDVKNCLRTSPKYSIPGLLESKFNIETEKDAAEAIAEMQEIFETYKEIIPGNQFHYFYQEFIPGINGVCNISKHGAFAYGIGDEQGDVVKGKTTTEKLSYEMENLLRNCVNEIHHDFGYKEMQFEFVITPDNELYIVQFRIMDNGRKSHRVYSYVPPENIVSTGISFYYGKETVNKDEVLVVDSDGDSKDLLGKKALIVKSRVEFSHLLALSRALRIPSIYGTGEIELPERFTINTESDEGVIHKD